MLVIIITQSHWIKDLFLKSTSKTKHGKLAGGSPQNEIDYNNLLPYSNVTLRISQGDKQGVWKAVLQEAAPADMVKIASSPGNLACMPLSKHWDSLPFFPLS